ncbi:MAG: FAD-binding protein [Bacteroidia bacterium]|nr:FAD-binding protein [Bacteroidia bacterium]
MLKEADIKVLPAQQEDAVLHLKLMARALRVPPARIQGLRLLRRSIDARGGEPRFVLRFEAQLDQPAPPPAPFTPALQNVSAKPSVCIVGFGPAGMFAALRLIELGYKPVILERGKAVRERRRDLAALNKDGIVNPESNYCFGEGGAGTFSDGKLYTRSTKRGDVRYVLDTLVNHGATPDILIDAHPHIGTNKLPQLIQNIRETILACGGEIHFDTKLSDFSLKDGRLASLSLQDGTRLDTQTLILATGHSARDIFTLLHQKGLSLEAKPFALGLRVEHPQSLIDKIQWHCDPRPEGLPAAPYSVVTQVRARGVYSFCMCPGGIICPAATAPDEVVVNGWSPSKRNSPYANSGMVVEVTLNDLQPYHSHGPLAGVIMQKEVEQAAFAAGGGKQVAPAMRLLDFVQGKPRAKLPDCSYLPGLNPADLREVLPPGIHDRLQLGFQDFGKRMKGFLTNDAVVVAVESRTSSPVRIPRDDHSLMHPQAAGLFPCGEGAGYAGGIMSAALDGVRCAEASVQFLVGKS